MPLSRQARTIGLASAVAAYSRMVSCHQGSLTLSARLFTRSGLALTCRAARYSWKVRCVKAYRPAVASIEQAVARDVVEERLASDRRGEALQLRPEDLQDAVGGEVADVVAHHLVGERGQQRLLGGPGQELRAGPWPGHGAKAGPGRSPRRGRRGCPAVRRGTGAPWRSSSAAADWPPGRAVPDAPWSREVSLAADSRARIRTARRAVLPEAPVACRSAARYQRSRKSCTCSAVNGRTTRTSAWAVQRAGQAEGPGGDHEVVARVRGDLPLDPVGHGEAVVGAGRPHQGRRAGPCTGRGRAGAPTSRRGSLPAALPTAARTTSGSEIAGSATIDSACLAQREQDGDAPAAPVPAPGRLGAAAGRVGEQGALAASGLADAARGPRASGGREAR